MSESAARVKRHRARKSRSEKLATYGFEEGKPPSEKVRQAVREAVAKGELEVPKEGLDDGSRWPWHPDLTDRTPSDDELEFRREIREVRLAKAKEFDMPISKVPLVRRGLTLNPVGTVADLEELRDWHPGKPEPKMTLVDTSRWVCAVCGARRGSKHGPGCLSGIVQLGRPPAA